MASFVTLRVVAEGKLFTCRVLNCKLTSSPSFTRAEHLRRHALNHGKGRDTCPRCAVIFTRPDLLARHMARHAKKDEEAGGPGQGVLETRKRSTREPDGTIVTRPRKRAPRINTRSTSPKQADVNTANEDTTCTTEINHGHPLSPPSSLNHTPPHSSVIDQASLLDPQLGAQPPSWFLGDDNVQTYGDDPSQWTSETFDTSNITDQMSFDDLFYTDTGEFAKCTLPGLSKIAVANLML